LHIQVEQYIAVQKKVEQVTKPDLETCS